MRGPLLQPGQRGSWMSLAALLPWPGLVTRLLAEPARLAGAAESTRCVVPSGAAGRLADLVEGAAPGADR